MVTLFTHLSSLPKPLRFGLYGTVGCFTGSIMAEALGLPDYGGTSTELVFRTASVIALLGLCTSISLIIGQNHYLQKRFLTLWQGVIGTLGGFAAGFISGAAAQVFFATATKSGSSSSLSDTEVLRIVAWAFFGVLLGGGMTFFVPNLKTGRALCGGGLGGTVGALGFLFVLSSSVSVDDNGAMARLVGFSILGFSIGLMVALAEVVFREAWLEISFGPQEIRTVSLGREPVSVGSDPNACTVYIQNATPIACRYTLEQDGVVYHDVALGHSAVVAPGDRRVIGKVSLTVRTSPDAGRSQVTESVVPLSPATTSPQQNGSLSIRLSSGQTIPLKEGARLNVKNIPGLEARAADGIIAEVSCNPADSTVLGLRNLSQRPWSATIPNGEHKMVEPGKNIRLAVGTKINFGLTDGEIQ